jgi:riboflavin synthase
VFTGLIAEVGHVVRLERGATGRLVVDVGRLAEGLRLGDSVAVNGACLTVSELAGCEAAFDVVAETLARTNLGELRPGSLVNLERPMRAGDEFGGHFVLGHVDGTGRVVRLTRAGEAELEIAAEEDIMKYVVEKGSIAIDGVSLSVARLGAGTFSVALIPHTLERTNLAARRPGDRVNLETDILGKFVERFVGARTAGLTEEKLRKAGF